MAARANLKIDAAVREAFVSAQASYGEGAVRWLRVEIDGETMKLVDTVTVSSDSAAEDMSKLAADVDTKGAGVAAYIVYCTDSNLTTSKPWILIAYVPETSKVRAKMLYASGREDLKRALGHTYFKGELHASASEDLSVDSLRHALKVASTDLPYTEEELLARKEKSSIHPGGEKVAVIAGVPLSCTQNLQTRLGSFTEAEANACLEVSVLDTETFELEKEHAASSGASSLASVVDESQPRFFVIKVDGGAHFLYFCPDGCKVKRRMLYSTAKAALISHLENAGVEIKKKAEVRDATELADAFDDAPVVAATVSTTFSRPARPGRGKRRPVARHFKK